MCCITRGDPLNSAGGSSFSYGQQAAKGKEVNPLNPLSVGETSIRP